MSTDAFLSCPLVSIVSNRTLQIARPHDSQNSVEAWRPQSFTTGAVTMHCKSVSLRMAPQRRFLTGVSSPAPAQSDRDTRRRRPAAASGGRPRARSRPDISCQSASDSFPIARSNSSSLIDRSASIFSRSRATRVR